MIFKGRDKVFFGILIIIFILFLFWTPPWVYQYYYLSIKGDNVDYNSETMSLCALRYNGDENDQRICSHYGFPHDGIRSINNTNDFNTLRNETEKFSNSWDLEINFQVDFVLAVFHRHSSSVEYEIFGIVSEKKTLHIFIEKIVPSLQNADVDYQATFIILSRDFIDHKVIPHWDHDEVDDYGGGRGRTIVFILWGEILISALYVLLIMRPRKGIYQNTH